MKYTCINDHEARGSMLEEMSKTIKEGHKILQGDVAKLFLQLLWETQATHLNSLSVALDFSPLLSRQPLDCSFKISTESLNFVG